MNEQGRDRNSGVTSRKTILILSDGYLPGFKSGGPVRTLANMIVVFGDEFAFKVVTPDRDLGSCEPYEGIKTNEWQRVGKAEVWYVSPGGMSLAFVRQIINTTQHDLLYLNSFFSPRFTIQPLLLRLMGLVKRAPTIIAARGELSQGALKIKSFKKHLYLQAAMHTGLYRGLVWRASSAYEKDDIVRVAGKGLPDSAVPVVIAPNIAHCDTSPQEGVRQDKRPGSLRVVFLSRLSPKKNLDGALSMLRGLKGDVVFDIYGPLEDSGYWRSCQEIVRTLPASVRVNYQGTVGHDEVAEVYSRYDLFLFPTRGENFGHVIIEALVAGCPIVVSDQTPWRGLHEKGVGWDLPLDRPERFTTVLQQCVDMGPDDMRALSQRARAYGLQNATDPDKVRQNRHLFTFAMQYRPDDSSAECGEAGEGDYGDR